MSILMIVLGGVCVVALALLVVAHLFAPEVPLSDIYSDDDSLDDGFCHFCCGCVIPDCICTDRCDCQPLDTPSSAS